MALETPASDTWGFGLHVEEVPACLVLGQGEHHADAPQAAVGIYE